VRRGEEVYPKKKRNVNLSNERKFTSLYETRSLVSLGRRKCNGGVYDKKGLSNKGEIYIIAERGGEGTTQAAKKGGGGLRRYLEVVLRRTKMVRTREKSRSGYPKGEPLQATSLKKKKKPRLLYRHGSNRSLVHAEKGSGAWVSKRESF